jgi:glucuronate isomerase
MASFELHPDRLLPADPTTRAIARRLYEQVAELPLVAVHGHVEAATIDDDQAFDDPARLLVSSDHYVTRVLHSIGFELEDLGVRALDGTSPPVDSRQVWRRFCAHWPAFLGTSTRTWIEHELTLLFGVELPLTESTADASYDAIAARLAEDAFRPQALFRRFGLELLSTTDPPGRDYAAHDRLQKVGLAVVPTLRPDAITDPTRIDWAGTVERLGLTSYRDLVDYLAEERRRSAEHGAVATDHGHLHPETWDLSDQEASTLFDRVRTGRAGPGDAERLAGHLLTVNASLSLDDGLVMQLHPGVRRDHDGRAHRRFGADVGADFPLPITFTDALRPLLERCGNERGLRFVVFTVDETVYSRELGPMASYWPGLYLGAPWWFLDAPDTMARHFTAVAESAGYAKLTGFVDDTRAYCSIPARHDVARRSICAHLARLVAEHRFGEDDAAIVAADYVYHQPKGVYRVG